MYICDVPSDLGHIITIRSFCTKLLLSHLICLNMIFDETTD